jgi:hypothetical protein
LAVAWIGGNLAFPQLAPTGIPSVAIRVVIHAVILTGLWLGLSRTSFAYRERVTLWLAIAIPFTLWLALIWGLAIHGFFQAVPGIIHKPPRLPLAIFLPSFIGLMLLRRSKRIAVLLDAMPPSWLIGLQLYRIFGGIFLVNWVQGLQPGIFVLPAGIGDVTVGVLALPVAALVASGASIGRKAGLMWNILGLADFAVAIAIGLMSSPGALHVASFPLNLQVGTFPTVMIPAFAVPSSIILHGLSIWQLNRLSKRTASR